jgi:CheY-like chemotaxis protein
MPKISGFDMLDILRGTPGVESTKVIMMTALGQSEDKSRAEKLGANRYLVKSQVTLEDVIKTVHEVLEGSTPEEVSMLQADISSTPSQPAYPAPTTPAETTETPLPVIPEPVTPMPSTPVSAVTSDPATPFLSTTTSVNSVVEPTSQSTDQSPIVTPTPVSNNESSPPLDTSSPTSTPLDVNAPLSTLPPNDSTNSGIVDPTLGQSSQEESSTVKSQIQDFLDPTPTDSTTSTSPLTLAPPAVVITPEADNVVSNDAPTQPGIGSVNIAGKKIIPTDSLKRPDIYSLLAKEEATSQPTPDSQTVQSEKPKTIDPDSIAL